MNSSLFVAYFITSQPVALSLDFTDEGALRKLSSSRLYSMNALKLIKFVCINSEPFEGVNIIKLSHLASSSILKRVRVIEDLPAPVLPTIPI